jgi:uncharacterized protein (TIGR00255 family)
MLPEGELVVGLKSLNHRGLELRFHMAPELDSVENALRTLLNRSLTRGHIDVRASLTRAPNRSTGLNRALFEAYLEAVRQAREQYGIDGEPDLSTALRIPGMLTEAAVEELGPAFEQSFLTVLEEALVALNAFREREGARLGAELEALAEGIQHRTLRVEEIREGVLPLLQARLNQRLSELLEGSGFDRQRLAQEAALLVDRSDICEELSRLKIHTAQLQQMLAEGGELGKRMDFLLQEMHRETNTMLSKTNSAGELGLEITSLALEIKGSIEKIREQALNLE